MANDINRMKPAATHLETDGRVQIFALNERLRSAQTALLRAHGYGVGVSLRFEDLFDIDENDADCLSIELHDTGMSQGECVARIRQAGSRLPIVLLSDSILSNASRTSIEEGGGTVFLLRQPVDVEEYLAKIATASGHAPR